MLIPFLTIYWLHSLSLVDAHASRDNVGCSFHLSCTGSYNGSIGQMSSGQIRGASDVTPRLFTWFGDDFVDQQGSGCWWTPPTFTLQCDRNQTPDHGFQIGCDGLVSFNGQTVFWECPTGLGDEVIINLQSAGGQCHEITIYADGCAPSSCPGGGVSPAGGAGAGPVPGSMNSPSSTSVPPTPSTLVTSPLTGTSNPPTSTPVGGAGAGPVPGTVNSPSSVSAPATASTLVTSPAPGNSGPSSSTSPASGPSISPLPSGPLTPTPFITATSPATEPTTTTRVTSLVTVTTTQPPASTSSGCVVVPPDSIILTDKGNPDTAYGSNQAMHIQVSPNASSIFNFRLDDADLGKTCEMLFLLPGLGSQNGGNPPYILTGTGMVTFAALDEWADGNTTYRTSPRVMETMSNVMLDGGVVALGLGQFECPGSTGRPSILLTEDPLADTCLDCFQGSGMGMFLRKC
ncbi:ubiquitin 3 binding protein But2 C-terminal domain-containing protein [Poronia punctata]|nr:ubiquitin 3 binding protein But2 C-terminal domain-containing protein [Poronia punctata]